MSNTEQTPLSPDLSAMISRVLANPQLLSTVASALRSAQSPQEAPAEAPPEDSTPSSPSEQTAPQDALPAMLAGIAPLLSALPHDGKNTAAASDPRSALLCALKPYLCASRCEAIDYMLRLGQLSSVLKHLQ